MMRGMEGITIENMSDQTHIYANDILINAIDLAEKRGVSLDQVLKCFELAVKEQKLDLLQARYTDQSEFESEQISIESEKYNDYE
ncbi:hypothetical protein [Ligilactobacillus salivarius]|uniref:Uncharacterized protein n=2 Tax=Ligilactobacillus salivarius TaxID=1624 RepID=A0A1V9TLI0_9LACO|nr:hypothetical protein [Ligilactobacillus salivarius]MDE7522738.1 hypothetical protein [Ligilactobacillus salivarius]MYU39404.1 hypothetical protein [Ligilactobacillus salivarius]MYY55200.1 hypothetical protein [Ligilactobacillus salivarius]MYZ68006.1 hypothetical protein [Ligilactobacillus salivarius]OQR18467.1 hypothetical protein B6U39_10830 [Ligilactobacillus salivarius]